MKSGIRKEEKHRSSASAVALKLASIEAFIHTQCDIVTIIVSCFMDDPVVTIVIEVVNVV